MRLLVPTAAGWLAILALAAGLPFAQGGLGVEPPPAPPPPQTSAPQAGVLVLGSPGTLPSVGLPLGPGAYTLSTATTEPQAATPYAGGPAMGAAFPSRDGTLFAVILPGQIEVRKAAGLDIVARLPTPTTPRLALAFTQDNQTLLLAGGDRVLQRWDLAAARKTAEFPLAELPAGSIEGMYFAFAPGGAKLGVAAGGSIFCFDAADGKLLWRAEGPEAAGPLALSADGLRLAAATEQGKTVQVFDAANGGKLHARTGLGRPVDALALAPDDSAVAAVSSDGQLNVWPLGPGGERTAAHSLAPPLYDRGSLVFSPDGKGLLLVQRLPQVNISSPAAFAGEQVTLAFVLIGTGYRLETTKHNAADTPWGLPAVYAPDGQSAHLIGPAQIEPYVPITGNWVNPYFASATSTTPVPFTATVPKGFRVALATDGSLAVMPDPAAGADSVPLSLGSGLRLMYNLQMRLHEDGAPGAAMATASAGGATTQPGPGAPLDATPLLSRPFLDPASFAGLDPAKTYVVELTLTLNELQLVAAGPGVAAAGGRTSPVLIRTLRQTFIPAHVPADPAAPSRRGGRGRGGVGAG